jgi:hypothetical protein
MNDMGRWTGSGLWLSVTLLTLVVTIAPRARGAAELEDGRGLDLRLFRPPVDPYGYLTVNGTDSLVPGDVGVRLTFDAGFGLVPLRGFRWSASESPDQAESTSKLVDSATTGTLALSLGIIGRLAAGIALPAEHLSGPPSVVPGAYNDGVARAPRALRSTGLGDLELSAKYGFMPATPGDLVDGAVPGVAAVIRVGLPTGDGEALRGDPGVTVWPTFVAEYAPFAPLRFGIEAGYRVITRRGALLPAGGRVSPVTTSADASPDLRYADGCNAPITTATCPGPIVGGSRFAYDDLVTIGAGAKLAATRRLALFLDWYAAGVARSLGKERAISGELALGGRYQVTSYVSATLGGAFGAPRGLVGATVRGFLSLIVAPSDADLDGDGYPTRDDACPDAAEDFDGFRDSDGCPDDDNDRDGVADVMDQCPDDRGTQEGGGCSIRAIGDRDGDGVNDYRDACPDEATPGTRSGCPVGTSNKTGGTR